MAVDQKELDKKILQRTHIRTMKKDLKALRESDSVKERQKISDLPLIEKKIEKIVPLPSKTPPPSPNPLKNISGQANENEKQQIFLLGGQKLAASQELQNITQKQEPTLALEKNNALLEQKDWQGKLSPILEALKKIEAEQATVENKTSNVPSEQESLQKEKLDLEEQKQTWEKKRWTIEDSLKKVNERALRLDQDNEKLTAKKTELQSKIAQIESSLQSINSNIAARQQQTITTPPEKLPVAPPKPSAPLKIMPTPMQKPLAASQVPPVKLAREIPPAIKEKFAESTKTEENQRKKFMEDIEAWASSSNKET